ncbi:hypothetical protein HY407_01780 [Candidatus Gottesmanbacteria bacterium]|nr:hypothetical protein [Candidatus Gottesmanbacteria bacterium]
MGVDEILRGQESEDHEGFNESLASRGIEVLKPVFEQLGTSEEVTEKTKRILSGEDGNVELPAAAAKAMYEAQLLRGYTLALGKTPEEVAGGWFEAGTIKHERPEENDSHGTWQVYRVVVPGVDLPIMTSVWLKAKEQHGTLDRDFTTWVLSREPLI